MSKQHEERNCLHPEVWQNSQVSPDQERWGQGRQHDVCGNRSWWMWDLHVSTNLFFVSSDFHKSLSPHEVSVDSTSSRVVPLLIWGHFSEKEQREVIGPQFTASRLRMHFLYDKCSEVNDGTWGTSLKDMWHSAFSAERLEGPCREEEALLSLGHRGW